ncbi:MAG: nucleotide pyrophosphatase, partial [Gemmatimonadales bacterium]
NDYETYPDFLTRLEQIDPEFETFAVVDWPPLGTERSGGPLLSRGIDVLRVLDGDEMGYEVADSQSVAIAVSHLTSADPDAAFVYLGTTDVVGHATSSLAPEYRAAIEQADRWVGELVAAVLARPTYDREDWLILTSTDHGRRDDGGHGGLSPNERTIFYLASGPSTRRGTPEIPPGIVDVAVTALAHLGVRIDPSWKLDGRVVGLVGR